MDKLVTEGKAFLFNVFMLILGTIIFCFLCLGLELSSEIHIPSPAERARIDMQNEAAAQRQKECKGGAESITVKVLTPSR